MKENEIIANEVDNQVITIFCDENFKYYLFDRSLNPYYEPYLVIKAIHDHDDYFIPVEYKIFYSLDEAHLFIYSDIFARSTCA